MRAKPPAEDATTSKDTVSPELTVHAQPAAAEQAIPERLRFEIVTVGPAPAPPPHPLHELAATSSTAEAAKKTARIFKMSPLGPRNTKAPAQNLPEPRPSVSGGSGPSLQSEDTSVDAHLEVRRAGGD